MHRLAISLFLCGALAVTAGCSGKSSSSSEEASSDTTAASSETETSVSETTSSAAETLTVTTETQTETKTETQTNTDITTASETSTETQETTEPEKSRSEPSKDCLELAQRFYQAYLDHDAETVYSLFDLDEIEGYNKLIEPELNGASAKEVFRKAAVIRAIEASMDNVREIMAYYATADSDKWSFKVTMDDLDEVDEESLEDYNKRLGTSFTSSYTCQYMIYNDDTNGKSFTGNSVSFVEKDGSWYLSYSSIMGSDLIYFIDFK